MESSNQLDSKSIQVPSTIVNTFKTLQKISTTLSGKLAVKLFLKPIKYPIPIREKEYNKSLVNIKHIVDGKDFTVNTFGSKPLKVLLIHGWSGRASQFYKIGPALAEQNISYATFTAPAHGTSKAKETSLVDFIASAELIIDQYGPFDTIIGHSLGGVAALNVAVKNNDIKNIVTIGTPASITSSIDDFCDLLGLNNKVNLHIINYIKKNFHQSFEEQSAKHLAKETLANGLIIHDTLDNDVDVKSAHRIHENWTNSEVLITNKLGHRRILADQKVINAILKFVV